MSDFFNHPVERKCRKEKRCMYCGQMLKVGEIYTHQTGIYDGAWQDTKMHPECFEECFDDMVKFGDGEYTLYSGQRPERAAAIAAKEESK